jgi:hypothetical protein
VYPGPGGGAYTGPGRDLYTGPGGCAYTGPGGGLYTGPGGGAYTGPGGGLYTGPGGCAYTGPGESYIRNWPPIPMLIHYLDAIGLAQLAATFRKVRSLWLTGPKIGGERAYRGARLCEGQLDSLGLR